jgi:hypothetical protein
LVSFKTRQLYAQEKSSWYLLDRRLSWPQIRYGHDGEEKNPQPLPGFEPPIIHAYGGSETLIFWEALL